MTRIVIIGGGPAGYEAALVAAQLGAQVTVIEKDGLGGASVLTDCVPSKTLIAAAGVSARIQHFCKETPAKGQWRLSLLLYKAASQEFKAWGRWSVPHKNALEEACGNTFWLRHRLRLWR